MYDARTIQVVAAVAIAVAVGGLFIGSGPAAPAWVQAEPVAHRHVADAPQAPAWKDMDGRSLGANARWRSEVSLLADPAPARTDQVPTQTAEAKAAALRRRSELRAYDGAPPVIPHPVDANDATTCIACHGDGRRIDTVIAPKMSHPRFTNCTQCHAQAATPPPAASVLLSQAGMDGAATAANAFIGSPPPDGGARAWPGAPPTMPHGTWMREDCTSCHGTLAKPGLRTTHPWRVNCIQCHAQSAAMNQADFLTK